jgi:cyclophilin family peptidyl-prolyl cis-trans isomerase
MKEWFASRKLLFSGIFVFALMLVVVLTWTGFWSTFGGKNNSWLNIAGKNFEDIIYTRATIVTSLGDMEIIFDRDSAPLGVESFQRLAGLGAYDGTVLIRDNGFLESSTPYAGVTPDKINPKCEIKNEPWLKGNVSFLTNNGQTQGNLVLVTSNQMTMKNSCHGFGTIVKGLEVLDAIGKIKPSAKGDLQNTAVIKKIILK